MASYKVPQDVEAEDKLIGPFSFRQFIYLIIAALGIFLAWILSRIFLGLVVLPLPIVFAFLALALPLRKDQPMETYLIAMIKFFFKPRRRLWDPEGNLSMITITALKSVEGPQLKDFGGEEAEMRLSNLAQIVDSQGWSTRGAVSPNDNLSDIFVADTSHAQDVYDDTSTISQSLGQKITLSDTTRLNTVKQQFQADMQQSPPTQPSETATQPTSTSGVYPYQAVSFSTTPQDVGSVPANITFNPYPSSIRQRIIFPSGQHQEPAPPTPPVEPEKPQPERPSPRTVSPDIMRLANNNDLSISAIAHEAKRISQDNNEVEIKLR